MVVNSGTVDRFRSRVAPRPSTPVILVVTIVEVIVLRMLWIVPYDVVMGLVDAGDV